MIKAFFSKPKPVSLEDGRNAVERLRARGRVDIDAFLNKLDVATMLQEPVGPTTNCLSLSQVEQYAFNRVTDLPHLAECDSCANALRAYRAVKERSSKPLPGGAGVPVPEPIAFGVEVPEVIDLVPTEFEFEVVLQMNELLDMLPSDLEVANAAFSEFHCQKIDMVRSDPDSGWIYSAKCVARRHDAAVQSFQPGAEFVDWIEVSGKTRAGQRFGASELVRFSVSEGVSTTVRPEV